MATYPIKAPDGRIFRIKGDSPPTEQELEQIYSNLPASDQQTKESVTEAAQSQQPSDLQKFTEEYNKQLQRSPITKLTQTLGGIAGGLASIVKGGIKGSSEMLLDSQKEPSTLSEQILNAASKIPTSAPSLQQLVRAAPNLAQTGLEAGGRLVGDAYQAGMQLGPYLLDLLSGRAAPPLPISRSAFPGEAEAAFEREQFAKTRPQMSEAPVVPEVLGKANVPLAEALPLFIGTEGIPSALGKTGLIGKTASTIGKQISKVASRGLTEPFIDAATRLTGISEQGGVKDLLSTAVPRVLESTGGSIPEKASDAVKAIEKAQIPLIEEPIKALQTADESLTMKGSDIINAGRKSLSKEFPSLFKTPEGIKEADNIIGRFKHLEGEILPTEGQSFLKELNKRYDSLVDKGSPEAFAYRAIRGELSDQLDQIVKGITGQDVSPYRDWGKLEQLKTSIEDNIESAQQSQAKSGGSKAIPLTKYQLVKKALVKAGGRPLIPREIEDVDSITKRVFSESPQSLKVSPLSPEDQQAILSKFAKGKTATIPPVIGQETAIPQNVIPISQPAEQTDLGKKIASALGINLKTATPSQLQTINDIVSRGEVIPKK